VRQPIARHPIAAFLVIGIGAYFVVALIPPLTRVELTALGLPLHGVVGGLAGVGLAAFLVTAAADGRAGVADLVARTLRWRVSPRWYLIALLGVPAGTVLLAFAVYGTEAFERPADGWLHVAGAVVALFVLQLLLFQLSEEVGWTGFFQDRLRNRYGPIALSAVVAFAWAVWHVPDFLAEEGWSLESVISSLVFLVIEFVLLFFARVVIVWLYEGTGRSVLLVVVFHASFDATISRLAEDLVPASDAARFVLVSAVVTIPAIVLIVAARRGWAFGRPEAVPTSPAASV
jgi:membrane protease YdiL (CAAX protease family)